MAHGILQNTMMNCAVRDDDSAKQRNPHARNQYKTTLKWSMYRSLTNQTFLDDEIGETTSARNSGLLAETVITIFVSARGITKT